jgi:probable F420-dependent oxidoreductase
VNVELGKLAITLPAPFLSAKESAQLAVRAETEWGYDAIWLAETNGPDSFTLAGAIAALTSRVTIGTAIVPVYNRSPAVLAMSASSLAELSEGRFVLGLGSSSHAIIEGWNGITFERPLAHVREAVEIVRQALAGRRTDFAGKALHSKGLRLGSVPQRPVPIYLAALRERMLELAGEVGEGLIVNFFPVSAMPQILSAYRRGAQRAGRDATGDEVVCRFQVAVTDDVPAARQLVRLGCAGYVAQPVYNAYFKWCGFEEEATAVAEAFARGDRAASSAALSDDLVDRVAILGSAESCREQVAAFVAAGVTTPVISPLARSRDAAQAVYEAFAPALAHRSAR